MAHSKHELWALARSKAAVDKSVCMRLHLATTFHQIAVAARSSRESWTQSPAWATQRWLWTSATSVWLILRMLWWVGGCFMDMDGEMNVIKIDNYIQEWNWLCNARPHQPQKGVWGTDTYSRRDLWSESIQVRVCTELWFNNFSLTSTYMARGNMDNVSSDAQLLSW